MKGKYIYGIISSGREVNLNKRLYAIRYNNLSAVVRNAPIKIYEADEKGLLEHNKILDEIMRTDTVLPMRFGTIAHSEDEVKGLLRSAYPVLLSILARIRDKVEFNMQVIITDEQLIIKEILLKNKEIRDFRDRLVSQGANAAVQDKLLIGKMIAGEVSLYKTDIIKEICAALKAYYSKVKSLGTGENFTFLVPRNKIQGFESTIYKLGEKYGDRIKFKYAGPLAPYSFVELRFIIVNFNTVDSARKQLGLGEQATIKEIKNAYRELAREYHPDKNPGDSFKEEEFKKIASSYRILYEYCRRYPKSRYVFKPGEIDEFSILVEEHE